MTGIKQTSDLSDLFGRRFTIDQTPNPITPLAREADIQDGIKYQKFLYNYSAMQQRYVRKAPVQPKDRLAGGQGNPQS